MGKKRKQREEKSDAEDEPRKKVPSVRSSDEPPMKKVCFILGYLPKRSIRPRISSTVKGDNIVRRPLIQQCPGFSSHLRMSWTQLKVSEPVLVSP